MNFRELLTWISGRKVEPQTPDAPAGRERRQFFRLDLPDGEVSFGGVGPFRLLNFSYGGLRFAIDAGVRQMGFCSGDTIEATVDLGQVRFVTPLEIRNVGKDDLGCSFRGLSPSHARLVSDYLKPRLLGNSLQEISAQSLRNDDPNLRMRWFQGDDNTQVYLWETLEGNVVKEEFYFLDYMLKYDSASGALQTAKMRSGAAKSGFGRIDQNAVVFFQVPSHRALRMGRVILESSRILAGSRDAMLAAISREERRLYLRYLPESSQRLRFQPRNGGAELAIANLSFTGIAFLAPETGSGTASDDMGAGSVSTGGSPNNEQSGSSGSEARQPEELVGNLLLERTSIPVKVRLIYRNRHLMGGKLAFASPAEADRLAAFLAPRLLGQGLEELPPPVEEYPYAPKGARAWLYVGFHNTHLLALVAPGNRLVAGRISFMDQVLVFEKNGLAAFATSRGVVFPSEWELPSDAVSRCSEVPADLVSTCREMLVNARISEEVRDAWLKVLGPSS